MIVESEIMQNERSIQKPVTIRSRRCAVMKTTMEERLKQDYRLGSWCNLHQYTCILRDRDVVLNVLRGSQAGDLLKWCNRVIRDDKEIVLLAVSRRGTLLHYASDRLKEDEEVVHAAVANDGWAYQYVHDDLRYSQTIATLAFSSAPMALFYAPSEIRSDKGILLESVRRNGLCLRWAVAQLRNDGVVVDAAVTQDGRALQYVSSHFKGDETTVRKAVANNGHALEFASPSLCDDVEIVRLAMGSLTSAFIYGGPTARRDPELTKMALEGFPTALAHMETDLVTEEMVWLAARCFPEALLHVPQKWKDNKEVVMHCVGGADVLWCASHRLRQDAGVVHRAVETHAQALLSVTCGSFWSDRTMVIDACRRSSLVAKRAVSMDLWSDDVAVRLVCVRWGRPSAALRAVRLFVSTPEWASREEETADMIALLRDFPLELGSSGAAVTASGSYALHKCVEAAMKRAFDPKNGLGAAIDKEAFQQEFC